jgi:hypothetical protein
MFFAQAKIFENKLKGVKMTQNPAMKAMGYVHAFWPKMPQNYIYFF